MKALLPLTLALAAGHASAADFIRQIQTVNNAQVIYQIDITGDSGQVTSKPLNGATATFQLYAMVTKNNVTTATQLAEKAVGTYTALPTATVTMTSEDPYVPARTRADRPYGAVIKVSGISSEAGATDQMKKVQVVRSYQLYDSTKYTANGTKGEYAKNYTFTANGSYQLSLPQELPVVAPVTARKAVGEETITAYTWPNGSSAQSQLGAATIQIWPVAEATFTGIEADKVYKSVPTKASVTLKDLYPRSTTYVQVYKGAPQLGTAGKVLPSTPVAYDTYTPQNAILTLADLGDSMKDSSGVVQPGIYTVEAVTITPFDSGKAERISYLSFTISNTIRVNGAVNSAEQR